MINLYNKIRWIFMQAKNWKKRYIISMIGIAVLVVSASVFAIIGLFTNLYSSPAFYYDDEPVPTPYLTDSYFIPLPPIVEESQETEIETEEIDDRPLSRLMGLPIDEEYLNRRPLAVVINNIYAALPQSGIASADIIYEVLAEGDITRLLAVFQSEIPEKIGPVRSARDYFVDFAFNHDGILVHHGASPLGTERIRTLAIPALDGMALEGRVFWRDRAYPDWTSNTGTRPLEHSSYIGWEKIVMYMEDRDIRYYVNDDVAYGFLFNEILPEMESSYNATRVVVPFSARYTRTFVFNEEYGNYLVENQDGAHMDAETAEQVSVTNILIQFASMRVVDEIGRRNVETVGEGSGYFISMGKVFLVNWRKSTHTEPTLWYFEDGTPLTLLPGRTWVCVFQTGGVPMFELE
jgi:hypothetical protein